MSSTQPPAQQRFQNSRAEYEAYLPLTQRIQQDLGNDSEELRAQEGWDEDEWNGLEEWIKDMDTIFRHLRRHRFDETKTLTALLSTLQQRITLSLHSPVPSFSPYTESPLFFILPLPDHTDRLGRPIAVLTVREVIRDADGKLDDLKAYAWWALEMVRRTLRDYWVKGIWTKDKKTHLGEGGEGMCVVVDANGAGYRNMEVELLPTLLSVGHNNFPGMIESVYVVNAGWTHRSMWNVVKRVLPKSALEKVAFLDTKQALESVFDLHRLPEAYGGNHPHAFSSVHNPIYSYYTHHSSFDQPFLASSSRNASYASIADIYYSAPTTPARSRRNSSAVNLGGWRFGAGLRMTKSREASSPPEPISGDEETEEEIVSKLEVEEPTPTNDVLPQSQILKPSLSRRSSSKKSTPLINESKTPIANGQSAIQRIKSLSDFHLYLSPSRLANLDLLSDSDSETESGSHHEGEEEVEKPRRILRPALLGGTNDQTLNERRSRPPLRLLGVRNEEGFKNARTYSDRLQQHHAKVLRSYGVSTPSKLGENSTIQTDENMQSPDEGGYDGNTIRVVEDLDTGQQSPSTPGALEPPSLGEHYIDSETQAQVVDEYDTSNPWYGYPVIKIPSSSSGGGKNYSIRPKYSRNRKRDLIKTLLFLFMLRLQSLRYSVERYLGLDLIFSTSTQVDGGYISGMGPQEGLLSTSRLRSREMVSRKDRDWWWMIIGFLLFRGTWSRLIMTSLETIGRGKEILGW
ncbi:hypothetical protein I302_103452 [Kwoniella bestiolae CBS 10118]|uniref:CRAL-TRIO domain-containing protein n=1 Tax=Kwoniella bestiolae CBS 10118 TaxID=1296100 RepID=A0A1B9G8J2_9TREE|nr:hypothetical protein I302_02152 [Kwoniella bestiolae CBS 10118]OCF27311.1 hypothetical protein I302_02152 [Kwoniella bestiolae CBS 10118]